MNPSEELKNVVLSLYESMMMGDVEAIERLISHESGVLMIGSDPSEWLSGYDQIIEVFKKQLWEMYGTRIVPGEMTAFREGTVGWVSAYPTFVLPNGKEIRLRETHVFHLEDGEWRIVQAHDSVGRSNLQVLNDEFRTSEEEGSSQGLAALAGSIK